MGAERPDESHATAVATAFAGEPIARVRRFPTGLAHYVYDVVLASGRTLVVRLGRPESEPTFRNAAAWSARLRPMGVPLPELLGAGTHERFPYLLLERIPGTDLGHVHDALSATEKRAIATEVVRIQGLVATLPEGDGYGFTGRLEGPFSHTRWEGVVRGELERSRTRLALAGAATPADVDAALGVVSRLAPMLRAVPPRAFLDDTTTKNVIVSEGRLRGIVDVDVVCFGDPLFPLALTRAALLGAGMCTDYTDAWRDLLTLSDERHAALELYTAVFCIGLLAELGHAWNADRPEPIEPPRVARLRAALDACLAAV